MGIWQINLRNFMFSITGSLDIEFMQYLEHLKFMENMYLLEVEHERGRNADGRIAFFDIILSIKINV